MKISKDDIISDVILEYPESIEIFMWYWLWCVWCWASSYETIEEWASVHFMSDEDIDNLVKDLNQIAEDFHKN